MTMLDPCCSAPRPRRAALKRPFLSGCRAAACISAALIAPPAFAQVGFFLTPPLDPGGPDLSTIAWGISGDAQTVVGQGGTSAGTRAYSLIAGQTTILGVLPGGTNSVAEATSANGAAIVGWGNSSVGTLAWRHFGGVMTPLGDLPGGAVSSVGRAVSANGNVVVGRSTSAAGPEAFRWENGLMVGLGDLPGGSHDSEAFGVSGDGSVVVGYGWVTSSSRNAFRWQGGVMTSLGTLGGADSYATAITPDGSIIVGTADAPTGREAFRWENGVMTGLGQLGPAATGALAVSADGSVVVGRTTNGFADIAVIWDEVNGMRSLIDVLQGMGLSTGGLVLREATGISADGRTIVGRGITPQGLEQAWIAVIPAPSGIALLGMVTVFAARRPRRITG